MILSFMYIVVTTVHTYFDIISDVNHILVNLTKRISEYVMIFVDV